MSPPNTETPPESDPAHQHPNWVFTIQFGGEGQPSQEDALAVVGKLDRIAQYYVVGSEVAPTTGQRHLQGYLQLKKRARRTELAKVISCFWAPAKGDDLQNYEYCTKDGDFVEYGTRRELHPGKRERRRWDEARDLAQRGLLGDIDSQLFIQHYGNLRAIMRDHMRAPEGLDGVCGVWIHGEAGVGKSFRARADYPNAYLKMCNKWWDGYQFQDNVIVDDFDKGHAALAHHLKIWADSYPFVAEIKGTAVCIRPKIICVTSQYSPEDIWEDAETLDAIRRRFKVIHMSKLPKVFHTKRTDRIAQKNAGTLATFIPTPLVGGQSIGTAIGSHVADVSIGPGKTPEMSGTPLKTTEACSDRIEPGTPKKKRFQEARTVCESDEESELE
jgi:hypothetical protein